MASLRRTLALVLLTSCAAPKAPPAESPGPVPVAPAPVQDTPTSPAPAPPNQACLPGDATEPYRLVRDGDALVACFGAHGAADAACVRVDPKGGAIGRAPKWTVEHAEPAKPAPEPALVHVKGTAAQVCPPGAKSEKACTVVKLGFVPARQEGQTDGGHGAPVVAVDAGRERLFAVEAKVIAKADPMLTTSWQAWGHLFDVGTGKRLARVPLMNDGDVPHVLVDPSDLWSARFLGARVHLTGYRCCGPAGAEELLDPMTGASLPLGYRPLFVPAFGATWLHVMAAPDGVRAALVDVDAGSVITSVQLGDRPLDDPDAHVARALALDAGVWAIATALPPHVTIVDAAKKAIGAKVAIPRCGS